MTSNAKLLGFIVIAIAMSFTMTSAWAADRTPDVAHGKTLVDKKCMGCHDNRQYTRPNRIIHTFEDLRGRVEFCDSASNANFSFDDLDDVVEFLNVTYYKFKK
jgi:cytochrome c2